MRPIVNRGTTPLPNPVALFSQYLDLTPLGSRRRGLVRCIFHGEKTASLSVDLDAGIFHCFGCAAEGGVRRFLELVGERPAGDHHRPHSPESELQRARRLAMQDERRRQARMAEWSHFLRAMPWLRSMERLVASVRATAPDTEAGWAALEDAATLERFIDERSAEIERILASGRVA